MPNDGQQLANADLVGERPNKIIGIGDIHIFNSKRFHEHKHVFQNLFAVLDSEKPDLIVVAGDVIDSKVRLSPEQVELCREFLLELCERAPIVLIPGNHDTNLQSKERMDSLSPILASMFSEQTFPVFYLKHSGLYNVYGIKWAVWSCIDDQKSPFPANFVKSEYIVGLYHGVVSGAMNDDGYKLGGGIDISEFGNCDMVIMADIHAQQSFRNNEINYTGSLIQVQVTENPDGSCLVYELDGSVYKHPRVVRIPNKYSTINMDITDAISNVLSTQKVRLKFDTDKFSRVQAVEIAKQIRSEHNVKVDVLPQIKKKVSLMSSTDAKSQLTSFNATDYMKEFVERFKDRLDVSVDDLDRLLEFDVQFSKGEVREFESGDYSIYKMVLNNFLSFGPGDQIIDLDKEGLVGIVGKNRVGKSSLIKAIQFCAFNEMPNNSTPLKMINKHNRSEQGSVSIYFVKSGKVYRIQRNIVPDKSGAKVKLFFHELDENESEIRNLTKESRPHTETEIRKYLGLNEMFEMLALFSAQKRQTEFIDCKNAERLKLVNQFLGLQHFELKEKNVMEEIKDQNAVYNNMLKQFDNGVNILQLERDLGRNETLLKIYLNEEQELKKAKSELEDTYYEVVSTYTANLKTANKQIEEPVKLRNAIAEYDNSITALKANIHENISCIDQLEADAQLYSEQFETRFGVHPADYKPDFDAISEIKQRVAVNVYEIKQLEAQMKIDICNCCGKPFTDEDKKNTMDKLRGVVQERKLNQDVAALEEAKYHEAKDKIKVIEAQLDAADDIRNKTNVRLDNDIKDLIIRSKQAHLEISEWEKVQDARNIVELLREKVEEYYEQLGDLNDKLSLVIMQIGAARTTIKELNIKIKAYKERIKALELLEQELRILKAYRKIVNKDGLPLFILRNKIDEINEKVNLIITQVFEFNIDFSIDEERGELKIQFSYEEDPEKGDVALASGSETFIINLCIKVGLSQISNLPKIDTVFIDEGYDSLDKDTIERIPALFNVLTNYYKNVITISHLDEVKDMCLNHIRLEKKGKYTEII